MAKESSKKASEVKDDVKETIQDGVKNAMDSYFDMMTESSERFAEGVNKARARNARIMDSYMQTLENGQKDMLALSRAMTAAPTDYKANLEMAMQTMTRRQECAIEFGKTLFREQSEVTSEVTERAQEMFKSMKDADYDWMAPYKTMSNYWTASTKS